MSDTLPFHYRLWRTPMRDLVRGRITGRLDWRGRLVRAALPGEVKDVIGRVVDGTRLWKIEKASVANELVSHFADGLDGGADAAALVRDFGDEKTAARLIRRAKRRGRPLAWHALYWTARAVLLVFGLYLLQLLPFVLLHPRVRVDYVAQLNGPLGSVPDEDRAWPLYRRAILGMGLTHKDDAVSEEVEDGDRSERLVDATPGSPGWPKLTAWLDAHAADLALARAAAAKPALGFVLGPGGSAYDPELGWTFRDDPSAPLIERSLSSVVLPDLDHLRRVALVLLADARYARSGGHADRVADDLQAVLRIGGQRDAPFLVSELVGQGIYNLGFDEIERVLAGAPGLLDDARLNALAIQVAAIGGDAPASLIDLSGEREMFYDTVQRLYSDNGHGDGILTWRGARSLPFLLPANVRSGEMPKLSMAVGASMFGIGPLVGSRKEVVDEFNRLMDLQTVRLQRPLRAVPSGRDPQVQFRQRLAAIRSSLRLSARYLPVAVMVPAMDRSAENAERTLGRRDGLCVGLALEMYRRQNGAYPPTLDALVPTLLPRVPTDRIDGKPVRYRLIDGRPVVYSVGVDRKDDAARTPSVPPNVASAAGLRQVARQDAAAWGPDADRVDGDWILYDARPAPAAATPATQPAS